MSDPFDILLKKKDNSIPPLSDDIVPLERDPLFPRKESKWSLFFRSHDLNNSPDSPYTNKPRSAYEFGIKIRF